MVGGNERMKKIDMPYHDILESISDGVFTIDLDWNITSFNRAAEEITKISRNEAIGKKCQDVFRSNMCEDGCPLRNTLLTGKPIIGRTGFIIDSKGEKIPISVSTAILKDTKGKIIGGAETFRDLSELECLREELRGKYRLGNIVSKSPVMQRIFEILPTVALYDTTVLITGETGTGKELLARAIHELSPRRDKPFIAINCSAIPDALLESELFGYKKGAFTGATKDKPGRFKIADRGTIFLDEIGDMSPSLQVKLLRVLEDKSFEPLGSTKTEKTDTRIITATNRDLTLLVKQGKFREDLYYRINVIKIELPPLRERKEDIPLLVEYFLERLNRIYKRDIKGLTPEALSIFMAHSWPGNIRELENVIESSFVLCDEEFIGIQHLPRELLVFAQKGDKESLKFTRELMEAHIIKAALESTNNNKTLAAKKLGIHKTTLFRKLKRLKSTYPFF